MDSAVVGRMRVGKYRVGVFNDRWEYVSTKESNGGIGVDVTRRKKVYDDTVNSTTGWYPHSYTESTITGVIQPRGATPQRFAFGTYVMHDAVFYTLDPVGEGDQILWQSEYYQVRSVNKTFDEDGSFAYRTCQLQKRPLYRKG